MGNIIEQKTGIAYRKRKDTKRVNAEIRKPKT